MTHLAFFLTHWFHYNYYEPGHPFYEKAVWGNVFVVFILAPLGWVWAKTKFWPLRPLREGVRGLHKKLDAHHQAVLQHHKAVMEHQEHQTRLMEEVHYLAHTGKSHPRVDNRIKAKKPITPIKSPPVK